MHKGALIAGTLICLVLSILATASDELSVHFINVGQGDAILIDYAEYEMLIDGGPGADITEYLRQHVDGPIEHLVVTHMDEDHIRGLTSIFLAFQIQNLWTNGNTETTDVYYAFRDAYLAEANCETQTASRGGIITLGDISVRILHPAALVSDKNRNSVVLLLSFNGKDFLFTGDIDISVENELDRLNLLSDIDLLKIAHHGSDKSTGTVFIEAVTPEICVASTSGQYDHPNVQTIERLSCTAKAGWRWLLNTGIHGTVVITVDEGGDWSYTTSSNTPPIVLDCAPPPPLGQVWINEVEPNPSGTDKANEWVELYNSGSIAEGIGGWQIIATHGTSATVTIPRGTTIQPGAFLVFYRSSQWIDNESEVVELRNDSGILIDKTPALNDTSNSGITWAKVPDGTGDWTRQQGTKGYRND